MTTTNLLHKIHKPNRNRFLDSHTLVSWGIETARVIPQTYHRWLRKTKAVIAWLPIIWKDEQFDHAYLVDIIEFKLKRMEAYWAGQTSVCLMSTDEHIANTLGEIREALRIIRRIEDYDYYVEACSAIDAKYGQPKWIVAETGEVLKKAKAGVGLHHRPPGLTDEQLTAWQEEMSAAMNSAHKAEQDDWVKLGNTLALMPGWWD